MSSAGFQDVEVKSWSTDNVWENRDEAWMALALANPIFAPLMDKIGKDKALRLQAVFDEILKKRFGDSPVKLKATAHFAIGTA